MGPQQPSDSWIDNYKYDPTYVDRSSNPQYRGKTFTDRIEMPYRSGRGGTRMPSFEETRASVRPGQVPSEPIKMPDSTLSPAGLAALFKASPKQQSGSDPNDIYKLLTQHIDPAKVEAAFTPVPTGHAMGLPPEMTREIKPYEPYPMDTRAVVGAGNARARGIGNAITGVANAIGSFTVAKQQKDQRMVAGATTRLMQAQQGVDQAQLVLKDPQASEDAKKNAMEAIQKNKTIMDDILSDDKVRKGVEKGFNISFTDPSKNRTDDHGAVQQGIKSFGEQFGEKMPTQLGPNVIAQQRLQLDLSQQAAEQKIGAAMLQRMIQAQSSFEKMQYQEQNINMRQLNQHNFEAQKLALVFQQAQNMAGIHHNNRMSEIAYSAQQLGQRMIEFTQLSRIDPTELFKYTQEANKAYGQMENQINGEIAAYNEDITKITAAIGKATDSKEKADLQHQLEVTKQLMQGSQQMMQNIQTTKGITYRELQRFRDISTARDAMGGSYGGPSSTLSGLAADTVMGDGGEGAGDSTNPDLYNLPDSSGGGGALP